jgi:hypothetical protein
LNCLIVGVEVGKLLPHDCATQTLPIYLVAYLALLSLTLHLPFVIFRFSDFRIFFFSAFSFVCNLLE